MKLKIIIFFILIYIVLNHNGNAQMSSTFGLSDTTVYQGQKHILSGLVTNFRGNYLKESEGKLDSIIEFLKNNPEITLEIGVHTDQRGKVYPNYELSKRRSDALKNDICSNGGIDKNRIIAIGYGEDYPIVPIEFISNINDKEEKEKLYSINRRVELQILEGNIFNKIENRINVLSKYRYLNDFHFLDSNILKGQDKVIGGIITSIDGKIVSDSLGQLDSLANLLANNTDLVVYISDLSRYDEYEYDHDELDIDLGNQRDYYIREYILKNKKIKKRQVEIVSYKKKRNFYSINEIEKEYTLNDYSEKPILDRRFIVKVIQSNFSNQIEEKFKSKINILEKIQKTTTNTNWEQSFRFSDCDIEYFSIPSIYMTLINSNTWEDDKNIGIGINIFEKEYKDLILLKEWTSDGSASKIMETKSYVIQMDYLERWSPKYNEIIDQTIYEIEQFFEENYEKL